MAGIDDVTPEIRIEGGEEVVAEFQKMAASAVDSFAKIAAAAEGMSDIGKKVTEGTETGKKALGELTTIGVEAFQKILDAAMSGDIAPVMGQMFGKVAQSITAVVEKITEFVEAQASVMETMSSLADATGMTISQIEGLKDAFASVGITTNGFERSIGRLAITVANEWSQIQQSVRTASDAQVGAMLHMSETAFGVQKAYHAMDEAITQSSRQIGQAAINIQQASLGLRQAMDNLADFALKSQQNSLSIEGAALNLQRAQLALLKDRGFDVSAQEKALKLDQDAVAIKEAQLRLAEAMNKKRREAMELEELQLRLAKARREQEEANAKAIEDSIKAADRLKEAQLNIQKAQLAAREAAEKAHELDLKDIDLIASEIKRVVEGYKSWEDVMNHAEISAQNLTKAVIKAASSGGPQPPGALDVFKEMVSLITKMGDGADASNKKIELVQHTMGAGFRAGQASAAQIVAVIERFGRSTDGAQKAMEELFHSTEKFANVKFGGFNLEDTRKSLLEFNSAFARLDALLDQVKSRFAAIASEPLTKMFNQMRESLEADDGVLRRLVEGLANATEWVAKFLTKIGQSEAMKAFFELLSSGIKLFMDVVGVVGQLYEAFEKLTGIEDTVGKVFKVLTIAIDVLRIALDGLRLTLATVVQGFGLLQAAGDKVRSMMPGQDAKTFAQARADSSISKSGDDMAKSALADMKNDMKELTDAGRELISSAGDEKKASDVHLKASDSHKEASDKQASAAGDTAGAAEKLNASAESTSGAAAKLTDAGSTLATAGAALTEAAAALTQAAAAGGSVHAAEGGHIRGPGSGTSDSIPARLSNGEFVVREAAVQHYGVPLFDALNSLAMGGAPRGFAMGGAVSARSASVPGGPGGGGPSSVLNLTIDGHQFNGLKAPEHVASKLKTYAVTRQSSSAGKTPSWMR